MTDMRSMSIKAFLLNDEGTTEEVRRFGIPEGASTNFAYLQQRIQNIFVLDSKKMPLLNILWQDSDGDRIVISSDDELLEAIAECISTQQQQLLKLYISPRKIKNGTENNKALHFGIVCDGCEGDIVGERFRCKVCPDYDLCEKCKGKGLHPQHPMRNLGLPSRLNPRNHRWNNFAGWSPEGKRDVEDRYGNFSTERGRFGFGRRGRGGHGREGRGCGRSSGGMPNESDPRCGRQYSGVPEEGCPRPGSGRGPRHTFMDLSECMDQFFPENVRERMTEANNRTADHVSDFVKNIWESWSGAFEQEGQKEEPVNDEKQTKTPDETKEKCVINIDIEMEDPENVQQTKDSATTEQQKEPPRVETPKEIDLVEESSSVMDIDQNSPADKIQEEWTLVNKETSPARGTIPLPPSKSSTGEIELSLDDDIQVISQSEVSRIYPVVPNADDVPAAVAVLNSSTTAPTNTSSSSTTGTSEQQSLSSEVEQSLQYMKMMGYSDEGGWLTRLLQMKKGDMNQVLDVLMGPHRK